MAGPGPAPGSAVGGHVAPLGQLRVDEGLYDTWDARPHEVDRPSGTADGGSHATDMTHRGPDNLANLSFVGGLAS